MGNFNQNNRSGGGRGSSRYGGRDSGRPSFGGGGRDSMRQVMHRATCAECGNDCEVPFRPSGDRPIYCSKCFETRRNGDSNSRGLGRNFGRPNFEERRMPLVSRSDSGKPSGPSNGQLMEQLNSLHAKLDKIISALEPKAIAKAAKLRAVKSPAPKKEVKEEKVETEKILES